MAVGSDAIVPPVPMTRTLRFVPAGMYGELWMLLLPVWEDVSGVEMGVEHDMMGGRAARFGHAVEHTRDGNGDGFVGCRVVLDFFRAELLAFAVL